MKKKLLLAILLTLIIGFLLGMLTSAQIRFHRLKPMRMYFSEDRFREGFYKIIQPDEKQKARIDLIIDKYAKTNSELQDKFRKDIDSNLKDLRKELDQNLTKDQLTRLKEMDKRREEMMRDYYNKHKNDTIRYRGGFKPGPGGQFEPDESQMPNVPPPPPFEEHDSSGSIHQK